MTPLVLLHGFLGCAEDWAAVCAGLAPKRPCFALDLPGHGSDPEPVPEGASFFDVANMLLQQLDALRVEQFDLLGYSMGGRLALGLLLKHPERVRRAIAVGASPGLPGEDERGARVELDERRAAALEAGPLEAWLRTWYAQPLFRDLVASPSFPTVFERRLRGHPEALAAALRALSPGRQPPLQARLRDCPRPLLLVAGARDERYAAQGRALAASSALIEATSIAGAGHAPQLEQPDAFLAAVRGFLDRDAGGGPP